MIFQLSYFKLREPGHTIKAIKMSLCQFAGLKRQKSLLRHNQGTILFTILRCLAKDWRHRASFTVHTNEVEVDDDKKIYEPRHEKTKFLNGKISFIKRYLPHYNLCYMPLPLFQK